MSKNLVLFCLKLYYFDIHTGKEDQNDRFARGGDPRFRS